MVVFAVCVNDHNRHEETSETTEMSRGSNRTGSRPLRLLQGLAVALTIAALAVSFVPCCLFCCCEQVTEDSCHSSSHEMADGSFGTFQKDASCRSERGSEMLAISNEGFDSLAVQVPHGAPSLPVERDLSPEAQGPDSPDLLRPGGLKVALTDLHCVYLT